LPPKYRRGAARVTPGSPFLTTVTLREDRRLPGTHPFDLPIVAPGFELNFTTPVTFFVGENGSGKSTLLEALACSVGYGSEGGSRDHRTETNTDGAALGRAFSLTWRQRNTSGFFLRAETFYNFTNYLESMGSSFDRYGGQSFHLKSHGEAFLALFEHRFDDGLFILDEPEAALSPQRQLAFLSILRQLTAPRMAQFIIATHSPLLLAFPGSTVLSLDGGAIKHVDYRDTDHYRLTRDFLEAPERFFRHLFDQPPGERQPSD
jgi:predicted ATPase